MRIQTQFDIGDKLRATLRHSYVDFVVAHIRVEVQAYGTRIHYRPDIHKGAWFPEGDCKLHGSFVHELDKTPGPDWKDTSIMQEFDPSKAGRGVGEDDPR